MKCESSSRGFSYLKSFVIIFLLIFFSRTLFSQTVGEVLQFGKKINSKEYLFLEYQGEKLFYCVASNASNFKWQEIVKDEKLIFLSQSNTVVLLTTPHNPLVLNYKATTTNITNIIDSAAEKALTEIGSLIKSTINPAAGISLCPQRDGLIGKVVDVQSLLKDDKKKDIKNIFEKLKGISFRDQSLVKDKLSQIKDGDLKLISEHFKSLNTKIAEIESLVEKYSGDDEAVCGMDFLLTYTFRQIITECKNLQAQELKRFENLNKCVELVEKFRDSALTSKTRINWIVDFKEPTFAGNKDISEKISVNKSDFDIQGEEIISQKGAELLSNTIFFKKFNRIIPEVSAGAAYTFIEFKKFGTSKNSNGDEVVSEAGNEIVRKINFTTMINWNYFTNSSLVTPLLQTGIGVNAGLPSFLVGGGFRFGSIGKAPPFAIAMGIASTWVKTLNKLKLGDKVSGTADLEKDLKYEFNWPPKVYIGFQFQL